MRKTPFSKTVSDTELQSIGITASGYISTKDICFLPEIRKICENNQCGDYGKTWACPPAVGSFEECRLRCLTYNSAFVFASSYQLADSFDWEGMEHGHKEFKQVCDRLYHLMEQPFLLLSNEGCIRCTECTYPHSPCRFPEKLFPSVEGYGIVVSELAKEDTI